MTHPNRGRLLVDLAGAWRLYLPSVPAGYRALGTVTRDGVKGALVLDEATGLYAQVNENVAQQLDQRKVKAAINPRAPGRPTEIDDGQRVHVYLDATSAAIASRLGEGNMSAGIRLALERAGGA